MLCREAGRAPATPPPCGEVVTVQGRGGLHVLTAVTDGTAHLSPLDDSSTTFTVRTRHPTHCCVSRPPHACALCQFTQHLLGGCRHTHGVPAVHACGCHACNDLRPVGMVVWSRFVVVRSGSHTRGRCACHACIDGAVAQQAHHATLTACMLSSGLAPCLHETRPRCTGLGCVLRA